MIQALDLTDLKTAKHEDHTPIVIRVKVGRHPQASSLGFLNPIRNTDLEVGLLNELSPF